MTKIQWTDVTWNPIRGCSLVSAGCANCYAMKQAHRFSGKGKSYEGLTELGPHGPRWTGKITLDSDTLEKPLRWKKPRRIFVNSMSDLFHDDVSDKFRFQIFDVMRRAHQHTFQILTKRPEAMRWFCDWLKGRPGPDHIRWPLPNVWLGVSVEDQKAANERVPLLLQTPAEVRFVSCEPLLGPVDLSRWFPIRRVTANSQYERNGGPSLLDWIIVGGESGPGARPCNVAWIRSIVQQCQVANVPMFVKQLGSRPFVVEGSRDAKEWGAFTPAVAPMDDCGWIHQKDRKGGDPLEWPEDLRVREWPR